MVVNCVRNASLSDRQLLKIADKVCRIIETELPAVSSTRFQCFSRSRQQFDKYTKLGVDFRDNFRSQYNTHEDPLLFYKNLVEVVKNKKMANCAEYSRLADLILGLNGIKSISCSLLNHFTPIDHAVSVILPVPKSITNYLYNLKNAIVIDPWLKFAANSKVAAEKYSKEFSRFIGNYNANRLAVDSCEITSRPVTDEVIKYFKTHYPNFFIKKGSY